MASGRQRALRGNARVHRPLGTTRDNDERHDGVLAVAALLGYLLRPRSAYVSGNEPALAE
jgi:hypothetical protein